MGSSNSSLEGAVGFFVKNLGVVTGFLVVLVGTILGLLFCLNADGAGLFNIVWEFAITGLGVVDDIIGLLILFTDGFMILFSVGLTVDLTGLLTIGLTVGLTVVLIVGLTVGFVDGIRFDGILDVWYRL